MWNAIFAQIVLLCGDDLLINIIDVSSILTDLLFNWYPQPLSATRAGRLAPHVSGRHI